LIPAGTFLMGSPGGEPGRSPNEGPRHEVEITRPFWLGAYPVTQQEYHLVMGADRPLAPRSRFPADSASWDERVAFGRRLWALSGERGTGRAYRRPPEAQWESACRAGASDGAPFHTGWSLSPSQANVRGGDAHPGYLRGPTAVGSYPPNAWGL